SAKASTREFSVPTTTRPLDAPTPPVITCLVRLRHTKRPLSACTATTSPLLPAAKTRLPESAGRSTLYFLPCPLPTLTRQRRSISTWALIRSRRIGSLPSSLLKMSSQPQPASGSSISRESRVVVARRTRELIKTCSRRRHRDPAASAAGCRGCRRPVPRGPARHPDRQSWLPHGCRAPPGCRLPAHRPPV